ncbi:ANKL1 protein, partial [Syrrhaptes paradoxus]|nr:ANKL1 protein [Syrrhaptes paradoxus]
PAPGGPWRSLSLLTEDGTDASVPPSVPETGPLSSTRRSLLEEPELGGGCGLGEPPLWPGCPPEPPSLAPRPHGDLGDPALPLQPLASSTLLGDELGEGLGDSSGGTERFVTAVEILEPSEAGGGHPQDPPPAAQGSPGSSPTVLLVPGDSGHPQDPRSGAGGSPCAAHNPNPGVLEGGSGRQDPSPLGTPQPLWPPRSTSHLLSPRPAGSTVAEPGNPLSPAGHSTHPTREHPEEQGQGPPERHSPGTGATTSPEDTAVQDGRASPVPPRPLSDEGLRRRLRALGDDPGPVTELTRRLYLRRLEKLAGGPWGTPPAGPGCTAVGLTVPPAAPGHSPELVTALQTGRVPDCAQEELALARQFDRPDRSRHWREGFCKSSFNYLLLDPRTTQNLPLRSPRLSPAECFRTFVEAIFYVGKGTRARPYCHLAEALSQHRAGTHKGCPKVRRILEIWASGQGVISLHCFQSSVPAEAYTREGCLVEALG